MISVRIKDANMALGQPDDWNPKDGDCGTLFVRAERKGSTPVLLSTWKPTATELQTLILGGSIVLGVVGEEHPPVLMYVSQED